MPRPKKGESKEQFISRCIAYLVGKEGKDQAQATAICYSLWEQYQKNRRKK